MGKAITFWIQQMQLALPYSLHQLSHSWSMWVRRHHSGPFADDSGHKPQDAVYAESKSLSCASSRERFEKGGPLWLDTMAGSAAPS